MKDALENPLAPSEAVEASKPKKIDR